MHADIKEQERRGLDRYAKVMSEQSAQMMLFVQQMKSSQETYMVWFKGMAAEVKGLAVEVQENTKVTIHHEAQRDALTKCLMEMKEDAKEVTVRITQLEKDNIRVQVSSQMGQGWIKWVLGGLITGIIALIVRIVTA